MLDQLCRSSSWQVSDLSGLGLLGLQPCFEDVILLLPVYISVTILSLYRIYQCYGCGPYNSDNSMKFDSIFKLTCCVVNFFTTIVLICITDQPAPYEILVAPFAMIVWISLGLMSVIPYFRFSFDGQWISRFVFMWIFVVTSIRWSSQQALGGIPNQSYYFNCYLVTWIIDLILLTYIYYERPILKSEFLAGSGQHITFLQSNANDGTIPSTRDNKDSSYAELDAEMKPVPWNSIKNPEGEASFVSRMLYLWMTPLFKYADKNTIEDYDVWDIRPIFRAATNFEMFDEIWQQEKLNPLPDQKPSLMRALIKTFRWIIFPAAPLMFIQNVSQLALPFLLGPLIDFMDNDQPVYMGYVYAVGFFVSLMVMTIAENAYFDTCIKTGVRIRSSMIPAIYRHAMRMSSQARQDRSVGAIVNHMSSDTEKIVFFCQSVMNLWSAPLRLALGLYLLIAALGVSGVFGIISVMLIIPLQTYAMKQFGMSMKEVMKRSDGRIKILNEVLSSMRVIKYYAWEIPFENKIEELRSDELKQLRLNQRYRAINLFFMNLNPVAMSVGTFVAFAYLKGNLSPSQAFQALALFQQLLWPLLLFPRTLSDLMETKISIARIEDFLLSDIIDEAKRIEDINMSADGFPAGMTSGYVRITDARPEILIENGVFSWRNDNSPIISGIDLRVSEGELIAIVGHTGSGKSSIASAMIGEMIVSSGRAKACGSIAYVPQQAWIYNATVRENILFGLPFDAERYEKAIEVSCLKTDIDHQFDDGDRTEIGEKGINLSGGQRQRVSIARAVYANSQVYVFDDPLSALDAHVTAEVFHNCIKNYLNHKTRVLVTNQLHIMPEVDRIVVLKQGRLVECGTFTELMSKDGEFHRLYSEFSESDDKNTEQEPFDASNSASLASLAVVPAAKSDEPTAVTKSKADISKEAVVASKEDVKKDIGKLVQAEGHTVGSVQSEVYWSYFDAMGNFAFYGLNICNILSIAASLASSMWLGTWSSESGSSNAKPVSFYIGIYVLLSLLTVVFSYICNIIGFDGAVNASATIHKKLVHSLLMAPISFFDSTPLGRITNRMSKDMSQIDSQIMFQFQLLVRSAIQLLGTIIILGINTTYVLVPLFPVMIFFAGIQKFYRGASVQLKRLEAVSRSPVYAHFTESLSGMATVRAYQAQSRMVVSNSMKVNINQKIYILSMTANRWLSIRLEFLGALLILLAAINCVILRNSLSASSAGIAMAYALQLTTQLNMLVRFTTDMESSFNSVERVQEYTNIELEAERHTETNLDPSWPAKGKIDVENLVVSYRPGLPPILKGITFTIQPLQKIGVCGRTGAGKSSLFQALFRMMEATSGNILFDGVDIATVGVEDLRNAISIIPQDPVLFSGTLRFNLDPFDQYTDSQLWEALEKSSLKEYLIRKGEKLTMKVSEGGENFSVGQRQLLCLARALIRKTKILVLDEATANVDVETDALIQRTIRENFNDRSTLTIAHRLNTIIDCDMILVLELGYVKEFDTPKNLMLNKSSEFYSMVQETGPQNASYLMAVALGDEASIPANDNKLVSLAREKLVKDSTTDNTMEGGPLMRALIQASTIMQSGWEERRSRNWDEELAMYNVPLHQWMVTMGKHLEKVNKSAQDAIEEEELLLGEKSSVVHSGNDSLSGLHLHFTRDH